MNQYPPEYILRIGSTTAQAFVLLTVILGAFWARGYAELLISRWYANLGPTLTGDLVNVATSFASRIALIWSIMTAIINWTGKGLLLGRSAMLWEVMLCLLIVVGLAILLVWFLMFGGFGYKIIRKGTGRWAGLLMALDSLKSPVTLLSITINVGTMVSIWLF